MADFVANLKHIYSIKEGWLTSNLKETKSRTPFQFSPHTTPEVSRSYNLEVYGNLCGSESYLWEFVTYSFINGVSWFP